MTHDDEIARLQAEERIALKAKDHARADALRQKQLDIVDQRLASGESLGEATGTRRRETPKPAPRSAVSALPDENSPEWTTDWLPAPVRDWCEAIHRAYAVPRVMPIAVALCAAATLAQGKVRVRIKDGWEEPLSLFWVVASPTGTLKSAVLTAGTRIVRAIQSDMANAIAGERASKAQRLKHLLAQQRSLVNKVKVHDRQDAQRARLFGKPPEDSDTLREVEAEIANFKIPSAPRWLREDINPTLIPKVMRANLEAEGIARMAVLDSEGGFLANVMGRHSKGAPITEPLLKGYQGEPLELTRSGPAGTDELVEVSLPACHFTMLAMVQPHILGQLRGSEQLAENGLMGRCQVTPLLSGARLPPADAPAVPVAVQAAYDAWLLSIHSVESGTVIDYSADMEPGGQLHSLYARVREHVESGQGAAGWATRSVGRVARCAALLELSNTVNCHQGGRMCGARVMGAIQKQELIKYMYSLGIVTATANEPASGLATHLARRAIDWLRQSKASTVGKDITIRELVRGLKLSTASASALAEELELSGHFSLLSQTINRNKTITKTYRIVSLDLLGDERPKPTLVAAPVADPESDGR
jgi:hypothetical protein